MGFFGKKESEEEEQQGQEAQGEEVPAGKYDEPCSLCGKAPTEKKWMGQYWHKKCIRKAKKAAKGMM